MENIESHVLIELINAFWLVATQLTSLIVPLIALYVIFKFISNLLFGGRA